ncbi:TRAP transporter substrate-binding protein [Pseudooceanicola sp. HF7]|uniref:TRAP transporter substrate-binding protein n=1 Tax=Pseudooceanicola sp. HF7 TaxID=2721560 RepID=UPI0014304DE9|nr:TRAP transporter substrate-binding protein [Pseudooceanicola sp. HF7]NIZ07801.1 TRAP transporter substrate-binding protein [Pseudooceanicola sp. HF7]
MKTIFRALAIAGALATSAAIPAQAQDIKVGLSLPEGMADFDFINGMYETFKSEVEANSDMGVDIVYGGALGAPNDRLAQMRRGVIQMSDAADGNIATIFPDIQILNMPYLFSGVEQARAVLDGPFGEKLAEAVREETGIKVLGWWESGGFKHFSANTAIATPADMEGLKMRVLGSLATIPVEALGASAAPVAFSELYTSLKTGVVDGQDNSLTVFNLVKLYEVQPHLSLTAHTYAFGPLGINDAFFERLDEEQQGVLMAAAEAAIAYNRETSSAKDAAAAAFARENGVEVLELDDTAKAAFAEVMQPVAIDWLLDNVDTPALIDEALAAADAK